MAYLITRTTRCFLVLWKLFFGNYFQLAFLVVCYTAVFSVVTQRSSPLRDDTKNGCVADYFSCGVGIVPSLFNVFALFQLVIASINNTKKQRISFSFWETAHLPLPQVNINTSFSLKAKCWLRGGVGGQFPRNV